MKTLKWTWALLLAVGLLAPAPAPADDTDQATAEATPNQKSGDNEKQDNPIPRLAELRLDEYLVPARVINLPLPGRTQTLQDVLDKLDDWSKEDKIGGVLLDVGIVSLPLADVQELRAAVGQVHKSGKKVHAFLNASTPYGYLLACSADEIAMAPSSSLMIPGLGAIFPFMKGHYDLLGYEYDVITAGRYKYPGFVNRREPDKFFTEEYGAILDSWFGDYVKIIADSRKLSEDRVREAINQALFNGSEAEQYGLVDTLAYYDEYRDRILKRDKMKRYRDGEDQLANVNSIQDLMQLINDEMQRAAEARKAIGPKIAVLHARGPIIDYNLGAGLASQYICRDDFVKVVDELRKNESIKAVVMRVDSPGGSGYASDVIWQHLRELDDVKPLVVSMGSVAGSGGYYIACPARRIFAQPTTITGSIGVIGMLRSARSYFNRSDVELAEMKRGERATLGAGHRMPPEKDRNMIKTYIDKFYDIFVDRVATTRKMPASEVRKIAEGRIWTGRDALKIGLVDELGGLSEAIEAARKMANIPPSAELKILHYPRPSSLGELFGSLSPMAAVQMVDTVMHGASTAAEVSFPQQVSIFSQRLEPLCWMGVPDFYNPPRVPMAETFGLPQPAGVSTGLPDLNGLTQP